MHCQDFFFDTAFWKKYAIDFHGTGLKILEIYAVMILRVGNIRFPEVNILFFFMEKLLLIHEFHEFSCLFFVDFSI